MLDWGVFPPGLTLITAGAFGVAFEVIRRPGGNSLCTHLLVGVT
jgi:hypothetical protein